jgi:hypothetical protein
MSDNLPAPPDLEMPCLVAEVTFIRHGMLHDDFREIALAGDETLSWATSSKLMKARALARLCAESPIALPR